jgi:hypothetical protein
MKELAKNVQASKNKRRNKLRIECKYWEGVIHLSTLPAACRETEGSLCQVSNTTSKQKDFKAWSLTEEVICYSIQPLEFTWLLNTYISILTDVNNNQMSDVKEFFPNWVVVGAVPAQQACLVFALSSIPTEWRAFLNKLPIWQPCPEERAHFGYTISEYVIGLSSAGNEIMICNNSSRLLSTIT